MAPVMKSCASLSIQDLQAPDPFFLVPYCSSHQVVQPNVPVQVVLGGHILEVLEDLSCRGVAAVQVSLPLATCTILSA